MSTRWFSGHAARPSIATIALVLALSGCSQGVDGTSQGVDGTSQGADGTSQGADGTSPDGSPDEVGDSSDTVGGDPGVDVDSPTDPPADDVDYEDDAGSDLTVYEYPDDPTPAEESAQTLCNLNRQYIQTLRAEGSDGESVVDDQLRLAVLSMSDNLLLWESMRSHYPEYEEAIDDAWLVRNLWDEALLNQENGDKSGARQAMSAAEESIADLPVESLSDDTDCPK